MIDQLKLALGALDDPNSKPLDCEFGDDSCYCET
jgi:hypothetical protein